MSNTVTVEKDFAKNFIVSSGSLTPWTLDLPLHARSGLATIERECDSS